MVVVVMVMVGMVVGMVVVVMVMVGMVVVMVMVWTVIDLIVQNHINNQAYDNTGYQKYK